MQWASTVSTESMTEKALRDAAASVRRQLLGAAADLIVTFVSEQHHDRFESIPDLLAAHFPSGVLVGCSAAGSSAVAEKSRTARRCRSRRRSCRASS